MSIVSQEYFTEIEALFARRRGTPFVVNAKDWALMKKWSDDGIPLPIVLEAIESVFDKFDAKDRKVNGLSFCKHAVKELWDDRRELQIGAQEKAPEEDPRPLLEALASALDASAHPFVTAFAARVREFKGSIPTIEERLIELEEELIAAILANAPDAAEMRDEARALSAGAGEKTRARTEIATLRRLVRERYEVPRLSLF
ncbi:MAG TPA: hypothetical protein VJZ00_05965 [Thermoanaerobaculia bacterium]|nr:hypothetical protein [Thermoanaerobaculia bacterium]